MKQIVGHSSFFFKFWHICDEFGKFCSAIAGKVLFEKSSHTSKNLAKAKENACSTHIQLTFKSPLFHKAHSKQVTRPITSIHIHHDTIILVLSEQIGTHSTYVLSFKIIAISNDNELYLFSPWKNKKDKLRCRGLFSVLITIFYHHFVLNRSETRIIQSGRTSVIRVSTTVKWRNGFDQICLQYFFDNQFFFLNFFCKKVVCCVLDTLIMILPT